MAHKDRGYGVLDNLKLDLAYLADIDSEPVADRNLLSMIMSPKKDIDKIVEKLGKAAAPEAQPEPAPAPEQSPEPIEEPES